MPFNSRSSRRSKCTAVAVRGAVGPTLEALESRRLLSVSNGSFEQGLAGWTLIPPPFYGDGFSTSLHWASSTDGSVREYHPKHGGAFALIYVSGEPGGQTTLSQSVTVAAGDRISGWAFFDAGDFPNSVDDDAGYVAIKSAGGETIAEPFRASVADVGSFGQTRWTEWHHTFAAPGTYTIEAGVHNGANFFGDSYLGLEAVGLNGQFTFPPNAPPTLDPVGPFLTSEGGELIISAIGNDPDGDWLDYAWDLDNDGAYDDAFWQGFSLGWQDARRFGFVDGPGEYTVGVRVHDGTHFITGTGTVTIENSPPSFPNIAGPASAKTGQQVAFTVATTDPAGAADPLQINWTVRRTSDNIIVQTGSGRAFSFVAPAVGDYSIAVSVTDGESAPVETSVAFTALPDVNHDPFFTNGSPFTFSPIEEGWSAGVSGSFEDIDQADIHSITVDWGDGTVEQAFPASFPFHSARRNPANGHIYYLLGPMPWEEAQANAQAYGADLVTINDQAENDWVWNTFGVRPGGFGAPVIWLGLTDDDAYSTEGNFVWTSGQPVTYTNWFSGEPNNNNNEDYAAMWSNFGGRWNDFRASDFIGISQGFAVLEVEHPLAISGREFAVNHLYADDGVYTATVTIDDGDSGVVSQSVAIEVFNAPPWLNVGFDYLAAEGQQISFADQLFEPGLADDWTVTVDYGDGTTQSLSGTGSGPISLSHAYADEGFYFVQISAVDDDGGVFQTQAFASVTNAAPRLSDVALSAASVQEGQAVTLTGILSDGGTADSHTLVIDWGDGAPQTVHFGPGQQGAFEVSHTYSAIGSYTVQYNVTDDDGASYFPPVDLPPGAIQWEAAAGGNGHWYAIVDTGNDWQAARAYAEAIGGQLLSINTAAEQEFLNNNLLVGGNEFQSYWIGLTDELQEGAWLWVDGEPLTYSNWNLATGEPNNFNNEDYAILNFHFSRQGGAIIGTWNDAQRTDFFGPTFLAVVEFTRPPAPPTVTVTNALPVVDAGDDAEVSEGGAFNATGAFTDASPADAWTAQVDYGDGSGWQDLTLNPDKTFNLSHVYAEDGAYTVKVVVTDGRGANGADELTVTVHNVAPSITALSGPSSGVRGQARQFTAAFTDPGTLDTHTAVWVVRDAVSTIVAEGEGLAFSFTPTDAGLYTIEFTVTDDGGGVAGASRSLQVNVYELQAHDLNVSQTVLAVGGSTSDDDIHVTSTAVEGLYELLINGVSQGTFAPTAGILVFAQAGDDHVHADGSVSLPVTFFGGQGSDLLRAGRAGGALVGGAGDDLLFGGTGRDLLIGGEGADRLTGGIDEDILVAGATAHDAETIALTAILAEWTRTDRTYEQRIDAISGNAPGLNGAFVLRASGPDRTVFDDGADAGDLLIGGNGRDWFFANTQVDDLSGATPDEMRSELGA